MQCLANLDVVGVHLKTELSVLVQCFLLENAAMKERFARNAVDVAHDDNDRQEAEMEQRTYLLA